MWLFKTDHFATLILGGFVWTHRMRRSATPVNIGQSQRKKDELAKNQDCAVLHEHGQIIVGMCFVFIDMVVFSGHRE